MGINFFSNINTSKFKKVYTNTFNLIVNYSYNDLDESADLSIQKINTGYMELIEIAKKIDYPYKESFNVYLPSKISLTIVESLLMITNAMELAFQGIKVGKPILENITLCCKQDSKTEKGRMFIQQLLAN